MASSREIMEALHTKVADSLTKRIEDDMNDNIPTDAATLSAAIKFLKDNDITSDPASSDDLKDLRAKMVEAGKQRKVASVLQLAKSDLANLKQG